MTKINEWVYTDGEIDKVLESNDNIKAKKGTS